MCGAVENSIDITGIGGGGGERVRHRHLLDFLEQYDFVCSVRRVRDEILIGVDGGVKGTEGRSKGAVGGAATRVEIVKTGLEATKRAQSKKYCNVCQKSTAMFTHLSSQSIAILMFECWWTLLEVEVHPSSSRTMA